MYFLRVQRRWFVVEAYTLKVPWANSKAWGWDANRNRVGFIVGIFSRALCSISQYNTNIILPTVRRRALIECLTACIAPGSSGRSLWMVCTVTMELRSISCTCYGYVAVVNVVYHTVSFLCSTLLCYYGTLFTLEATQNRLNAGPSYDTTTRYIRNHTLCPCPPA